MTAREVSIGEPEPFDPLTGEVLRPLGLTEAKKLDNFLCHAVKSASNSLEKLLQRLDEAKRGQIHVALGYTSWTTYVADRLAPMRTAFTGDTRREVVTLLAGEGTGLRAIATATGTSKTTVARDLADGQVSRSGTPDADDEGSQASEVRPATITGTDGKKYPDRSKAKGRVPRPAPVSTHAKVLDLAVTRLAWFMEMLGEITELDSSVTCADEELPAVLRRIDEALACVAAVRDLLADRLEQASDERTGEIGAP